MKLFDYQKNGIMQDVWFLTRSTSASYPMLDIVRNVNEAYKNVSRLIWEVADGWEYDDSNYTSLPIAKTNLVQAQQDYSVPINLERLHRVEILDGTGNWDLIPEADWGDEPIAMPQIFNSAIGGLPQFYKIVGQSIQFYPTPTSGANGVTLANGLALYFDRDIMLYMPSASSHWMSATSAGLFGGVSANGWGSQPGFAQPFHRILSLAAAMDYEEDSQRKAEMIKQRADLEMGLTRFYSKRNLNYPTTIKPYGKKRWRRYL